MLEKKDVFIESNYWTVKVVPEANRWHEEVKKFGFARVPHALFEYAGILDLSPSELGFLCMLLHHMRYKKSDGEPTKIYPSLSRMSDYKIVADRGTLSNLAYSLQEKGLIRIITEKGKSNTYDPAGLFAILIFLVKVDEEIQERVRYDFMERIITERKEGDEYRFKELKVKLEIRKQQLGLI